MSRRPKITLKRILFYFFALAVIGILVRVPLAFYDAKKSQKAAKIWFATEMEIQKAMAAYEDEHGYPPESLDALNLTNTAVVTDIQMELKKFTYQRYTNGGFRLSYDDGVRWSSSEYIPNQGKNR